MKIPIRIAALALHVAASPVPAATTPIITFQENFGSAGSVNGQFKNLGLAFSTAQSIQRAL